MKAIVAAVTEAVLSELTGNSDFVSNTVEAMTKCGPILDRVKQDAARELERRVAHLERENASLHDENDAQEQYSRRNRLLLHGVPEVDTDNAVLSVANEKLGLNLTRDCIDRSHRLGQAQSTSNGKTRPIMVKLTSYDTRRKIFGAKRQLKGTRLAITENLAALGAPTEGTVSRRRSGNVDPRRTHCLPCGQRPKGNRSNRARLGKRARTLPKMSNHESWVSNSQPPYPVMATTDNDLRFNLDSTNEENERCDDNLVNLQNC